MSTWNPFRRRPVNPIDQLSVDELRAARVRMEHSRTKVLKEIKGLEDRKSEVFQQGVGQPDQRGRRIAAQQIVEIEEQTRQLDQQLAFYSKQLTIVSRLEFLKRNSELMAEMGIDKLLVRMDTGELRSYVEEGALSGEVTNERLDELAAMLGEAVNTNSAREENPEIADLVARMEMASLQQIAPESLPPAVESEPSDASSRERN